uniref:Riboflavin biosynthesis protein n=2 Tax=Candidatus Bipolaricaulota TaxID=67810 RepID=H5SJ57_9BACT|nr:riboflavin biosynthesis protein RibF [uncultured Acetothermia bacterium]BAL59933.1 riboflavin biosynthesis protein RibF [Candidatus Acetothermum autotrophicum]
MALGTLRDFSPQQRTALTLGTFDGVHRGHRALLERTAAWAREHGALSVALVFTQPPPNYMGTPKPLLLPVGKKLERVSQIVEHVIAVEFPEVGWMEAEEFVQKILVERLQMAHIVIGPDARFGKHRRGDSALLEQLGERLRFSVEVVPPVRVQQKIISATAIRESLSAGRLEEAREMLGYAPTLWGTVVHGDGRGRQLGYPTANLALDPHVLVPAAGVYAVRVCVKDSQRDGVLYIGSRSTFADASPSIEVHLFDTDEELYGIELEVALLARLRDDQRFDSLDALREQIERDIDAARTVLRA